MADPIEGAGTITPVVVPVTENLENKQAEFNEALKLTNDDAVDNTVVDVVADPVDAVDNTVVDVVADPVDPVDAVAGRVDVVADADDADDAVANTVVDNVTDLLDRGDNPAPIVTPDVINIPEDNLTITTLPRRDMVDGEIADDITDNIRAAITADEIADGTAVTTDGIRVDDDFYYRTPPPFLPEPKPEPTVDEEIQNFTGNVDGAIGELDNPNPFPGLLRDYPGNDVIPEEPGELVPLPNVLDEDGNPIFRNGAIDEDNNIILYDIDGNIIDKDGNLIEEVDEDDGIILYDIDGNIIDKDGNPIEAEKNPTTVLREDLSQGAKDAVEGLKESLAEIGISTPNDGGEIQVPGYPFLLDQVRPDDGEGIQPAVNAAEEVLGAAQTLETVMENLLGRIQNNDNDAENTEMNTQAYATITSFNATIQELAAKFSKGVADQYANNEGGSTSDATTRDEMERVDKFLDKMNELYGTLTDAFNKPEPSEEPRPPFGPIDPPWGPFPLPMPPIDPPWGWGPIDPPWGGIQLPPEEPMPWPPGHGHHWGDDVRPEQDGVTDTLWRGGDSSPDMKPLERK